MNKHSVTTVPKGTKFVYKEAPSENWYSCKLVETCDDRGGYFQGYGLLEYLNREIGHTAGDYAPNTDRRFLWVDDSFFTESNIEIKFLYEPIGIDDLI